MRSLRNRMPRSSLFATVVRKTLIPFVVIGAIMAVGYHVARTVKFGLPAVKLVAAFDGRLASDQHMRVYTEQELGVQRLRIPGQLNGTNETGTKQQPDEYKCKNIFVRAGGLTQEGYGSFFQRIKSSIILSMALNKTLVLADEVHSEHNYSVTAQVNEAYENVHAYNKQRAKCVTRQNKSALSGCDLQLHEHEATALDFACRAMYAPSGGANRENLPATSEFYPADWLVMLRANQSCPHVHQTKAEVPGQFAEDYEGFNDCIQPWLSTTFHNIFKRHAYQLPPAWQTGLVHVGIHIRWGDVASANVSLLDSRSVQLSDIRTCVRTLQKTKKLFEFHIFVKNPSESLLSQIDFDHTVVNNDDDLYDMFLYSHMDMYIQGESSFSAIASLINPRKIVITNAPASAKYSFYYFEVNTVYAIGNLSYVDRVLAM